MNKKRNLLIRTIAIIVVVVMTCTLLWYSTKTASNDRTWSEAFTYTPHTSYSDGLAHIGPVRDWTYAKDKILSKRWIPDVSVDPQTITQVWFLLEPFPDWSAVGHTYLTFEFSDGSALSFSVEARMEEGESYSALKGLMKSYELAYTWGTERDFLTRRVLYLDHAVYRYPLNIQHDTAVTVFNALAEATNTLSEHPVFYNTLTANCTNILAQIVNNIYANKLPYDISWNLPGTSDEFLMKQGFIKLNGSFETTRASHDISSFKTSLSEWSQLPEKEFSEKLRVLLSQTESQ